MFTVLNISDTVFLFTVLNISDTVFLFTVLKISDIVFYFIISMSIYSIAMSSMLRLNVAVDVPNASLTVYNDNDCD